MRWYVTIIDLVPGFLCDILLFCVFFVFFFFSSRRRHTRWTGDWSSDVCSSDLALVSDLGEFGRKRSESVEYGAPKRQIRAGQGQGAIRIQVKGLCAMLLQRQRDRKSVV